MEHRRCESCLKLTAQPVCEHCGYPVNKQNGRHQLPVGTVLGGRYRIGRVLGQGGFGITYLGWDLQTGETVAVKEFYPGSMVNRDCSKTKYIQCNTSQMEPHYRSSRERFLREAKALAQLRDVPEIVSIQNFLEEIVSGGPKNEGNFAQSARVQEIINAATLSHREHRWVDLPL